MTGGSASDGEAILSTGEEEEGTGNRCVEAGMVEAVGNEGGRSWKDSGPCGLCLLVEKGRRCRRTG